MPGPIPDSEGGSGHGLEQIVHAWDSWASGTTLPVTVHLHSQLGWIWNHPGDVPLGITAREGVFLEGSGSRKAKCGCWAAVPRLNKREEASGRTPFISLCFPTVDAM